MRFYLIIWQNFETIIRNWWLKKLRMTCYPCIQITFDLLIDFWMPFSIWFFVQRLLHTFMDLRLDFAVTKRRSTVVGLISNMIVNKHSDFLSLGFLTGDDVIWTLGMLSVTPYGVDSIAASIISLRLCWSSHLPACWYLLNIVYTSVFKRRPGEWWLVNTNSLHMIFKTWWLQHAFYYNTLFLKCVNR